jgi:purine-binding chemotaxis protein CheW
MNTPQTVLPASGDKAEILRARARVLAKEVETDESAQQPLWRVVEFNLGQQRLAVEAACVREVCPLQDLTPLPHVPPFICGIVNVRGQILTVVDLKRLLNLPDQGLVDRHHVLVVHTERGDIGLLTDGTPVVRMIRRGDVVPALPTLTGIQGEYVLGVTHGLAVLDAVRLLADPKLVVNQEIGD